MPKSKLQKRDEKIFTTSFILTILFASVFVFGSLQSAVPGYGIVDVKFTGEIPENSESNLLFVLANDGRTEDVVVRTASENIEINPKTVNAFLNKSVSIAYILNTDKSQVGKWKVTFEACSLDSEDRCLSRTITGNVLEFFTDRCGDNVCGSTENINTCPQDCSVEEFLKTESDLSVKRTFVGTDAGKIFAGLLGISALTSLFMFVRIRRKY